jgi:cysteinyl-tRNA synthetase
MTVRFYDTLARRLREFQPIEPGRVRMYTCGPTVYNFAHIGNFRAYLFEDLLRRTLKFAGYRVTQVMNLTDVDDKTIAGARREGVPLRQFTQRYKDAFFEDLRTLGVEPAEAYPAATDHVPEMIALIRRLMDKGIAYRSDDGSVYFSIEKFPNYGALCRLDKSGLRAGARVSQDEYEKENVGDFALWKAWDEKDGDVAWDSPWGRGRPGWHIECSAMSMKFLGESFDIHTGGVDNVFPHHDDEIAQSEAATGRKFVNYWLHCAHLIVEGRKMSKSLGNFFTLRDVLGRGYTGREIRYELIATHYRQPLDFSYPSLDGRRASLARLDEFRGRLATLAGSVAAGPAELPGWASEGREAFRAALFDDLNISGALGALFDMLRLGNKAIDARALSAAQARAALDAYDGLDRVLGFLQPPAAQTDPELEALLQQRQEARKAKNWAEADRIRVLLAGKGWAVQDTAQGPKLRRM